MGPDMDHGMNHDWGGFGILDIVGWLFAATLFVACSVLVAVIAPGPLSAAREGGGISRDVPALRGGLRTGGRGALRGARGLHHRDTAPVARPGLPGASVLRGAGGRVLRREEVIFAIGRYHVGNAMAAVVGALILAVAYLIPVLGDIFLYGFALFGAGASVLASSPGAARETYPLLRLLWRSARRVNATGGGSPAKGREFSAWRGE